MLQVIQATKNNWFQTWLKNIFFIPTYMLQQYIKTEEYNNLKPEIFVNCLKFVSIVVLLPNNVSSSGSSKAKMKLK